MTKILKDATIFCCKVRDILTVIVDRVTQSLLLSNACSEPISFLLAHISLSMYHRPTDSKALNARSNNSSRKKLAATRNSFDVSAFTIVVDS